MAIYGKAEHGRAVCVMAVCGRANDCKCGSAVFVTTGMVDTPSVDLDALGVVWGNSTIGTLDVCIVPGAVTVAGKAVIEEGRRRKLMRGHVTGSFVGGYYAWSRDR